MELQAGTIVRSCSGRDEGFFLVVKIADGFAYIANGRSRLLEKPKRKNPKHLQLTRQKLELRLIQTDKQLRKALWKYNFGGQPEDE